LTVAPEDVYSLTVPELVATKIPDPSTVAAVALVSPEIKLAFNKVPSVLYLLIEPSGFKK
jgi:hypothetical protein